MIILAAPQNTALQTAAFPLPKRLVVMGASAGGLRALSVILAALPAGFPAPVLVVQHLSPDFPSKMAHILGSLTNLTVKEAEEGDHTQAGVVYLAPPSRHLLVNPDLSLSLSEAAKVHHSRPSVDMLFRTAAASFGAGVIGVVLTGGDGDGAAGIESIKAAGGVTIAQDVPSSEQPSMPRSAAATGQVDFVLPLTDIAGALVGLVRSGTLPPAAAPARDILAQDKASVDLASCSEALRVAEEALRVQSDVIKSYLQTLKSEPTLSPSAS